MDGFWEPVVARVHNDSSFNVSMSYAGLVDADEEHTPVNPNRPVPHRRSGAWL